MHMTGRVQVGHFFLVHEQVAVAGEAERAMRADGEPGEQLAHEALEKWPLDYLEEVVPHLVVIIKKLDSSTFSPIVLSY